MTKQILGGKILKEVKQRCEPYQSFFEGKSITIVMFDPDDQIPPQKLSQYKAAVTSTNQKVKTFEFLGCNVNRLILPPTTKAKNFRSILINAADDANTLGIIVQNPIPTPKLSEQISFIPARLDIDAIKENNPVFKASATSEAIARLAQNFASTNTSVAVVGAKGFVGSGVVRILEDASIQCIKLDYGDDLARVRQADIVVSAVGEAELLDERHIIPSHRLVVDSAFIPQPDGSIKGDVNSSAYSIPQYLTPVPGGVGPLQMAVLLERIVELTQEQTMEKWFYQVPELPVTVVPDISVAPDMGIEPELD